MPSLVLWTPMTHLGTKHLQTVGSRLVMDNLRRPMLHALTTVWPSYNCTLKCYWLIWF